MTLEQRFVVIRDQGYGRVLRRVFNTEAEATVGLIEWQDRKPNGTIEGGDWSIRAAQYEVRADGSEFFHSFAT